MVASASGEPGDSPPYLCPGERTSPGAAVSFALTVASRPGNGGVAADDVVLADVVEPLTRIPARPKSPPDSRLACDGTCDGTCAADRAVDCADGGATRDRSPGCLLYTSPSPRD